MNISEGSVQFIHHPMRSDQCRLTSLNPFTWSISFNYSRTSWDHFPELMRYNIHYINNNFVLFGLNVIQDCHLFIRTDLVGILNARIQTLVGMFVSLQVSRIHPAATMRIISILVPLLLLLPPGAADLRARSFKRYSERENWETARATCRLNHTDLATVTDASEDFSWLSGWIGLYRENSASEWRWSRGDRKANFTPWRAGNQKECMIDISVSHVPVIKTVSWIKI